MREEERDSISAKLIWTLSYRSGRTKFTENASVILDKELIPFLAFELGKEAMLSGRCKVVSGYFDKLLKEYNSNPKVVIGWARSKMDCGEYSRKLIRRLKKIYKREGLHYGVLAQMIRYLSHESDFHEIEKIISELNINSIEGIGGAELFNEWARHEVKAGNIDKAELLLNKALVLDPKNIWIHGSLGELYLLKKKNLPKAVAFLKNYIHLASGNPDAEAMKSMITDLEREIR